MASPPPSSPTPSTTPPATSPSRQLPRYLLQANHRQNRVRAFFKCWSITGIKSDGEDLVFEVGLVTVKYPSNNFDGSPECEGKRLAS
ncbi:unnamed protein product [Camellia sinensis]